MPHILGLAEKSLPRERHQTGENQKRHLGRVYNSKLGCFAIVRSWCRAYIQPSLELKTRPRFAPVSLRFFPWLAGIHGQTLV
jgi:hypothetical protein